VLIDGQIGVKALLLGHVGDFGADGLKINRLPARE